MPEKPTREPSAAEKKGKKQAEQGVRQLQKLWGADTESDVLEAIGFFEGLNPEMGIRVVNNPSTGERSLAITLEGEDTRFYTIGDDYEGFVEKVGTILTDATYFDEAKRENPLDKTLYPNVGTALGETERVRTLNPDEIGQEMVEIGGVEATVNDVLAGLEDIPTNLIGGVTLNQAKQMDRAAVNATRVRRILEDLGVSDDIQVRVEKFGGSRNTPSIVITSNGQDRSFSMLQGELEPIKNYLIEEIASVASASPVTQATPTTATQGTSR